MNLFAGKQWRCRHREQTCGYRARGTKGKDSMETYTVPYVKQMANGNSLYDSGNPMRLSENPEGWGRKREGDSRGRGHMYTYADSC